MQASNANDAKSRKIVLKASGSQPPIDMQPGDNWIVRCHRGEIKERGNQIQGRLKTTVMGRWIDGKLRPDNEGVILRQWYFLGEIEDQDEDVELDIDPQSKYGLAWSIATGRPLKSGENPSPKAFEGKLFRVSVGYSSRDGNSFSYRNLGKRKGTSDFLRIHEILEKIEEKALTHMTSLTSSTYDNVICHEHEHDTRTLASTKTPTQTKAGNVRSLGAYKSKEQRPQGHANGPGAADERLAPGITTADVRRVFEVGAPTRCGRCGYDRVVKRTWPGGRWDWMCHSCGREVEVEAKATV